MSQTKLNFRFYPFPNEAYHGYLARLALDNGFLTTQEMLSWSRENIGLKITHRPQDILHVLTGHSDAILENIPLKGPDKGKWPTQKLFGDEIPFTWQRLKRECHICPICTLALESTKLVWQFNWTRTCAIHQCALISDCMHCGEKINYDKAARNQCGCGVKFESHKAEDRDQLAFDTAFDSYIAAKMLPTVKITKSNEIVTPGGAAYWEYEICFNGLSTKFIR